MGKSRGTAVGLLQSYLRLLGGILLVHGVVALLLPDLSTELPRLLVRLLRTDPTHAIIHVIWGAILLWQVPFTQQSTLKRQRVLRIGFTFSIFYLGLGFLGILIQHPIGMQLDRGENVFHILIGSTALILSSIGVLPSKSLPR